MRALIVFLAVSVALVNIAYAETRITQSGYLASVSESALDKATDYLIQDDRAALAKLIEARVVFELKPGLEVYIVKSKMFSGKVKIRPVGQTVEVWTYYEAVKE